MKTPIHTTKVFPVLNFPNPAWVVAIQLQTPAGFEITDTQIIHFN